MPVSYGRSTYQQLIDDVIDDLHSIDADLASRSNEAYQRDTLSAEERISSDREIAEQWVLRYRGGQVQYPFQDRPPITGVSDASPMTVKSAGHAVPDFSKVTVVGVQGNEAANGMWFTSGADSAGFIINPGSYIQSIVADPAGSKIVTEKPHGQITGAVATLHSTPVADGDYPITVIDGSTFTIAATAGDYTYTAGRGVVLFKLQSTGSGLYTAGGRYWLDSEIPTSIGYVKFAMRDFMGTLRKIDRVGGIEMTDNQDWSFSALALGALYAPTELAHFRIAGARYLRFHPPCSEDHDMTLYGVLRIWRYAYQGDPLTATVHLDNQWDEAVKAFMRMKALRYAGKMKEADEEQLGFEREKDRVILRTPVDSTIRVSYR